MQPVLRQRTVSNLHPQHCTAHSAVPVTEQNTRTCTRGGRQSLVGAGGLCLRISVACLTGDELHRVFEVGSGAQTEHAAPKAFEGVSNRSRVIQFQRLQRRGVHVVVELFALCFGQNHLCRLLLITQATQRVTRRLRRPTHLHLPTGLHEPGPEQ